jgi:hypothetical protein
VGYVEGGSYNKMDLKETGCEAVDLIPLTQNKVQWWVRINTIINLGFH